MVKSGTLALIKVLEFQNQYNKKEVKIQRIMETKSGNIIGEDSLWFHRPCSYTAKVISSTAEIYFTSLKEFTKIFGKVINPLLPYLQTRHKFIEDRFIQLKEQAEYNVRHFIARANPKHLSKYELDSSRQFNNTNNDLIKRNIMRIYLREGTY